MASILRREEIELLSRTRDILEEILETLEITSDRRTLKSLQEGLRDMKAGRVRPYAEFPKSSAAHMSHKLTHGGSRRISESCPSTSGDESIVK